MLLETVDSFNQSRATHEQAARASALAMLLKHDLTRPVSLNRQESYLRGGREPAKPVLFSKPSLDLLVMEPDLEETSFAGYEGKTPSSRLQADISHIVQMIPTPICHNEVEQIPVQAIYRVVLSLMEREQISLARKTLDALPVGRLDDPMIARLRKLLAVPTTKTSHNRDIDRAIDYKWIRDHAQEYSGQWVALSNGQLLGTATSLRALLKRINSLELKQRPLLHQITS